MSGMKRFAVTLLTLLVFAGFSFAQSGAQAYQAGRDAYDKGDYATAITQLTEAAKDASYTTKANVLLNKAKTLQSKMKDANAAYNAGKYSDAKALYQEVLASNAGDQNAKSGVSKCDQKLSAGNNNNNNNGGGGGVGGNTPTTLSITSPSSRTLSFGASGGSQTIQASSNISLTYSTSGLGSWCTVSQSGKNFTVQAKNNTSTSSHSGTLTISTTDGAKSESFTIKQSGASATLTVDQPYSKSYTFPATGGTYTIKVSSNTDVKFSSTNLSDWCQRSVSGKEMTITASANDKTTTRSGSVTVRTADGSRSETISISQSAASPTLTVSPTSLSFVYSPSYSKTVTVTTNLSDYTVESSQSWCTVTKYSTSFNVNCSTNYSSYRRYATITVKAGNEVRTVAVDQDPYPSSSSSSGSSYSSHSYSSGPEAHLAFGFDFTMEFTGDVNQYGLGIGANMRFTLFDDDLIMLDTGIRAAYLADIKSSTDYYYEESSQTYGCLYVPLALNLNLGGFYFGGGYQWDFGSLENSGYLGQIGLTTGHEGADMRLYCVFGDTTLIGFGMTAYF